MMSFETWSFRTALMFEKEVWEARAFWRRFLDKRMACRLPRRPNARKASDLLHLFLCSVRQCPNFHSSAHESTFHYYSFLQMYNPNDLEQGATGHFDVIPPLWNDRCCSSGIPLGNGKNVICFLTSHHPADNNLCGLSRTGHKATTLPGASRFF